MTERNYTVYMHVNKFNNMKYIGYTSMEPEQRWGSGSRYKNGQVKFYSAIKEFGWNNFEHIIIKTGLTKEEAWNLEEQLILEFNTINNGYNSAYGGEKNRLSEESKQKLRNQRLGENNPNYNPNKKHTYKKSRNKNIQQIYKKEFYTFPQEEESTDGRKSIEARQKHKESKLGRKNPNYGKHSWNYNKKLTENQKQKIYESWTNERKELARQQRLGSKNP